MADLTKELFLYEGEVDYLGNCQTEDRYIIIDSEGFDLCGEHFTAEESDEIIINLIKDENENITHHTK